MVTATTCLYVDLISKFLDSVSQQLSSSCVCFFKQTKINFWPRVGEGDKKYDSNFCSSVNFQKLQMSNIESQARAHRVKEQTACPSSSRGWITLGRKVWLTQSSMACLSLLWFLSLLLKGTRGRGWWSEWAARKYDFFFLVPCDWRKFCLLLLIQKIFSKVTFSLFYTALWLLLVEVTLLGVSNQFTLIWLDQMKSFADGSLHVVLASGGAGLLSIFLSNLKLHF